MSSRWIGTDQNRWSRRLYNSRWAPSILTKVDEPTNDLIGELSDEKEMEFVFISDLNPKYKTEFLKWLNRKKSQPFIFSRSIKKLNEEVVEDNIDYAVNLEDWREWIRWKLGLKDTTRDVRGIPSVI